MAKVGSLSAEEKLQYCGYKLCFHQAEKANNIFTLFTKMCQQAHLLIGFLLSKCANLNVEFFLSLAYISIGSFLQEIDASFQF